MTSDFERLFKKTLTDTLKKVTQFLADQHLEYRVAYGTAIGAVRHHNLIPWDDDIDIYMLRADYEKLPALVPEMEKYGLGLLALPGSENYWLSFGKFYNLQTTVIEKSHVPNVGVWVDIFPLDYTDDTPEQIQKDYRIHEHYFWNYWKGLVRYPFSKCFKEAAGGSFKALRHEIKNRTWYRLRKAHNYRKWLDFTASHIHPSGKYLVSYEGREFFKAELYQDYVTLPFADFEVKVPAGYDQILTAMYGDYMTPPPAAEQVATHSIYYTNLEKRLSQAEVEESIRNKEYETNPMVNYMPD